MSTTPMGMRQTKHIFVGETRIATKNNWWQDTGTEYEKYNTYWYHADHLGSAQLVSNWKGEEYERIEYTPYGEIWVEKVKNGHESINYRFTGKEMDSETGLYYFGARYLDPKYSRWLSTDPALRDYIPQAPVNDEARKNNQNLPGQGGLFNHINSNLYHYGGNNPVRYVDPDGREAGDVFDSQDEAAKDFAITYNDDSIKNNVELGTYIRQDGNKYFYDIPVAGTESNVKLSRNKDDSSIVAMIHTHGAYTDENQNQIRALEPSIGDINTVKQNKLSLYTVTPDGGLFLTEYTESNKENVINYSFTPKAPSDSNCPYRKNNLDAKNYPDNFFRR